MATTDAATADLDTVQGRHRDLAARDQLPDVHLVDAGYVSVGADPDRRRRPWRPADRPLPPDTSWQAGDEDAFDLTRFRIDYDAHHVVWPNGKTSRNWQPAYSRDGLPTGPLPRPGPRPTCNTC